MRRMLIIIVFAILSVSAAAQNFVMYHGTTPQKQAQKPNKNIYTLRPQNIIIGTSLIGLSFPVYFLTSSTMEGRIQRAKDNYDAKLEPITNQYKLHVLSHKEYTEAAKTLADDLDHRLKNITNSQKVINYACAGASIVGVIIVLTGIKKEAQNGIQIAENFYYNGAGITWTF